MELSFLHPGFLWALPAAAAPLALHWIARARPRRLAFSSVDLLRSAVRAGARRARLRDVLVLVARCLLLAALVALFSRPVLHWGGAAAQGDAVVTVLLLDVSYSMGSRHAGASAFERARAQAEDFVRKAPARDRVGLVAFSNRVELSLPPLLERDRLLDALAELEPTARTTDFWAGLQTAYQMLGAEPDGRKALVILSDLTRAGWERSSGVPGFDPAVRVLAAEMGPAAPNAAVTDVRLDPAEAAGPARGRFSAASWGDAAPRGWRVAFNDETAAQGRLPAANPARDAFSFPDRFWEAGHGVVALEPDALALDDARFFPVERPRGFSVFVVNGAPGLTPVKDEAFFLKPVLETLARNGLKFHIATLDQAAASGFGAADVVVLLNAGGAGTLAPALQEHLRRGGGLLVAAGDNVLADPPAGIPLPGRFLPQAEPERAVAPTPAGEKHPLGRVLADGFEWRKLRFDKIQSFEPAPGAVTLLAAEEDGRPLLVVDRALGGRAAVFTSTLDRDWSNLPSKPVYPVLCAELLSFLAGRSDALAARRLLVDEVYEAETGLAAGSLEVARPDGGRDAVSARGGRVRYEKTDRPGLYRLLRPDGQELGRFVVNVDVERSEGDPARLTESRLAELLPAREMTWIDFPEPVAERFGERMRGKDLTPPLALAALLLFALEAALATAFRLKRAVV